MAKRLLAWVVLLGFVVLLINIVFLHIYLEKSLIVYVIIILLYLVFIIKSKEKEK